MADRFWTVTTIHRDNEDGDLIQHHVVLARHAYAARALVEATMDPGVEVARLPEPGVQYVNAYAVTRNYGGPEEGGWWYDQDTPLASVPVIDQVEIDYWKPALKERFAHIVEGNMYSVLGGTAVVISVEDEMAQPYPAERPHYE